MENLEVVLNDLEKSGSNTEDLKKLGETLKNDLSKGKDIDTIMHELITNIRQETENFFRGTNQYDVNYMTGFTSGIYLPSFDGSGEIKLVLYGGDSSRENNSFKIDSKTMFDVASITKLFTLVLTFKLSEEGIINLNDKIADLNPDFKGLEDFTFTDLIRMHGDIYTDGNVAKAANEYEAYEILKTAYLKDNTRDKNKYTDFGAIIIGKTLEKVMSEKYGKEVTLNDLMDKYIFKPSLLSNTTFNPKGDNVSGNGGNDNLVHDPKSRILGGMVGSAGIFTTSTDLNQLAKSLYSVNYINKGLISKKYLDRLGEITFPNSPQSNKGNLGIYVKHPMGYDKTFTPSVFSTNSFSHQGWTGAVALFDPNNNIHVNFLPNAIVKSDIEGAVRNDKAAGFMNGWDAYEKNIIDNVMLMMIAKKYFNMYKDIDYSKEEEIKIK